MYQITEIKTEPGNALLKEPIMVTLPMTMTEDEANEYGNVDFTSAKEDVNYSGNPYWEGSPTALVALINVDIQPHVITRKLNVLAGRLYTEHGIFFRSERDHEGRKLRFWKGNTENA